jgi:hypothetical protein
MLAGCESNTAWIYGSPESEGVIGARIGGMAEDIELGALAYLDPYDGDNEAYGVYGLYHIPITENVTAYGGAEARIGEGTWDIDSTIEPVAGVSVGPAFIEWQEESVNGEDDKILFGVRFKF